MTLRQVKVFLLKGHQGFEGQADHMFWSACSFFQVWAAISVLRIQNISDGISITLAKRWKQHKFLSVDEGINTAWSFHTMEHHVCVRVCQVTAVVSNSL